MKHVVMAVLLLALSACVYGEGSMADYSSIGPAGVSAGGPGPGNIQTNPANSPGG
jgi:hypothetical protein